LKASNAVLETLRSKYRKEMNDISDFISGGGCEDYSAYKNAVGIIEGLARAERELLDLDKKIIES
jgi:hypothetical protein